MAERRTLYKIFVASPSDVAQERKIARDVIEKVSKSQASQGVILEACEWKDTTPGLGRTQALINPLVKEADLLVGFLWKRFGTSTGMAESGTEEEFDIMYNRWQAKEAVDVMMYFREVPREMLEDPGPQLRKVLDFRRKFEQLGLYRTYKRPQDFAEMLPEHLTDWVAKRNKGVALGRVLHRRTRGISESARSETLMRFVNVQAAEHRYLQMTGFETRVRIPMEIERVLVPVRVRSTEYTAEAQKKGLPGEELKARGEVGEAAVIDFEEAWQEARRRNLALMVLGHPGSGKTTLLRHLLLHCVSSHEQLRLSRSTVPLLIPLRLVKPSENFEKTIHRVLETRRLGLPMKFFDRELRNGDALLLFDGLDEVASASVREKVSVWVKKQHGRFPGCPMVITSRFAGYVGKARLEIPHLELALERFREKEIRDFLQRWFVTLETTLGEETEFFHQRGREAAADLAERIAQKPDIYGLATNPLMLQIIALVHRDRGTLPDRRIELYDECTNVLLEHWDRAKGGIDIPLTAREARRVLEPVAYWLHRVPERRYAKASALLPVLGKELARLPGRKMKAKEFLNAVRDRSGLFVGHGVDEYGFQHLSFQEYLAANQVPRGNHYDELAGQYGESWWHEVTRLLMGLDRPNCFEPFMRILVASKRFINNHSLTAACIRDSFEPSVDPFVSTLEATFNKARQTENDSALLQYHILLALRELPKKHLRKAIRVLKKASDSGESPEVKALANELLITLGITVRAARDTTSGLPSIRINPIDGTELVLVPTGAFERGSEGMKDNPPKKDFLTDFYLARYPVTNGQYKNYVDANPQAKKPDFWDNERFNQPKQPVVVVSAEQAEDYCRWAGLRLATEWEWEKGARGIDGRLYPWGKSKPTKELANFGMNVDRPTPVGSYPKGASPYGLMDMAGNVWEWTSSIYRTDKDGTKWRTLCGGSFGSAADELRAAYRGCYRPGGWRRSIGFRCAQGP